MSDFKEIVDYLRIIKPQESQKNTLAYKVDFDFSIIEDGFSVKKEDLINSNFFYNLNNFEDSKADILYLQPQLDGSIFYYRKGEFEENGSLITKFKRVPGYFSDQWESLDENTLTSIDIGSTIGFYYDQIRECVIYTNTLDEVIITNDVFVYDIDDTSFYDGEESSFNYQDHEGYTNDLSDKFLRYLLQGSFNDKPNQTRRSVTIYKNKHSGLVHLVPNISNSLGKYILRYKYVERGLFPNSFMAIRAIKLEFNYFGSLLEFLNQTIFYHIENFESKERKLFLNDYLNFVEGLLRSSKDDKILEILYYVPISMFKNIDNEFIWNVLITTLESSVTNAGLNTEDIVLKLLQALEENYNSKNIFLAELVNKKTKDKEPVLERLLYRIDSDNFQKLLKYIWNLWKVSDFSEIDPEQNKWIKITDESPVLLDYRSDKEIGFHVDNADIKWTLNKNKITVDLKVKTGVFVERTIQKEDGEVTYLEEVIEIENYQYYPLSPIVLISADNPKFIYKDDEQESKPYFKLPAFVLFAREESAFWQNILTSVEYAADILSTISGVGNIIKVGRLYKVLNAGKKLTNTTRKLTKVITLTKATVGVAEISSGTVNALLKLTDIADTELGREISKYLFYFEILALSGELSVALYSKMQKSAKTILAKEEVLRKTAKNAEETKQIDEVIEELRKITNTSLNLARKFGKITKEIMKKEMPIDFLEALKKMGRSEDEILEYYTKYHNENEYIFLNGIEDIITKNENITKTDAFSLWSYTTNHYYWDLNNWLRNGIHPNRTNEISELITNALFKMPKYDGTAFRALEFNDIDLLQSFLKKHEVGKTVDYNDFVSCGSNTKAAFFDKAKKNVFLRMEVKNAPIISDFADGIKIRGYAKDELLLLRGKKFKIIEQVEEESKYLITLKEL